MKQRVFITDFDGTLLNDNKKISEKDIQTLHAMQNENIKTVVATGRSMASFEMALDSMAPDRAPDNWPFDYVIFSTGAGIMRFENRQIIYQRSIPAAGIKQVSGYFEQQRMDYMVLKAIPDTHYFEYKSFGGKNPDFQYRIDLYSEYASALNKSGCAFEAATEVMAILPGGSAMERVEKTKQALPDFSVVPATSPLDFSSIWVEVFPATVSKSQSAQWLCRYLGTSEKNVVAVGNDYNDQDLLEWAGRGFIVSNAPAGLRSQFTQVLSNNRSGFSQAVHESGWISGYKSKGLAS